MLRVGSALAMSRMTSPNAPLFTLRSARSIARPTLLCAVLRSVWIERAIELACLEAHDAEPR